MTKYTKSELAVIKRKERIGTALTVGGFLVVVGAIAVLLITQV